MAGPQFYCKFSGSTRSIVLRVSGASIASNHFCCCNMFSGTSLVIPADSGGVHIMHLLSRFDRSDPTISICQSLCNLFVATGACTALLTICGGSFLVFALSSCRHVATVMIVRLYLDWLSIQATARVSAGPLCMHVSWRCLAMPIFSSTPQSFGLTRMPMSICRNKCLQP